MKTEKRLYLTADRTRVVEEGDPDALTLFAAEGDEIVPDDAKRYKLGHHAKDKEDDAPAPKAVEAPEDKAVPGPPENKARNAASKKDDK